MSDPDAPEELPAYAVRLTERAQRDIDEATLHFAETASEQTAVAWREGFYEAIAALATLPRAHPFAPERFRGETRQMQYRRAGNSTAYRVLFTIAGEEPNALDAPTAHILHVRHAAARPLTRAHIRAIEAQQ